MNLVSKLIPVIVVLVTIVCTNFFMGHTALPNYGVWTGIRPIEDKLKKLEAFAKEGPVDAIVLGSSIADFGFSAELYSKLMSEKLGRPYRVFNFSTGSAELTTIIPLYRIARTVAKPKAIFLIVPAQLKRPEKLSPYSADYILLHAPIGQALNNSILLQLSNYVWTLPIIEKSAALRDMIMFGRYRNLIGEGMDTYLVTAYGDRVSYTAGGASLGDLKRRRIVYEGDVRSITNEIERELVLEQNAFFPVVDIDAMTELKRIAFNDDIKIYVMAHSAASALWISPTVNTEYKKARVQFFNTLSRSVNGTLLNPLNGLSMPDYATMDDTHLNSYGANIYTQEVFRSAIASGSLNQPRPTDIEPASLWSIRSKEATFNNWAAVVIRERGSRYKSLKCRFMQNFAVPVLPPADLFFALRMPDGSDIISPARQLKSGEYEADFALAKSDKKQALILRLLYGDAKVPLNAPLASYAWTSVP